MLDRLSKWVVVISALVALASGTLLGARAWPPLLWWVLGVGVAGFAAARGRGSRVFAPVMLLAYIFPAVMLILHGFMDPAYWNIWMAGLLGATLGVADLSRWRFPERWKWPLAYWALAVALVWPAVVAREADFSWALMQEYNIGNAFFGGSPPVIAVWILHVALLHLLGLLWVDAAFTVYPLASPAGSRARFLADTAWPLALSVLVGALVAIYQGTVDLTWLSGHQYSVYKRAAASLDDGNAFGAVAGMWIGGLLALAAATPRRWLRAAAVTGVGVAGAGLWATGSRMALLAGGICVLFALWFVVTRRKHPLRDLLIVGLPAAAIISVFSMVASRSQTASPVDRVVRSLPGLSGRELRQFASFELWNRFGPYGTVSMNMVRDYPLSGIGVGSFNHIFPDESFALVRDRAHPDNAQSWYRHQLAELGVLGSLGWIVWVVLFAGVLVRSRGDDDQQFGGSMIKGGLVGMALISAVSMPTQSLPVAFTVWVFVYWFLLLSSTGASRATAPFPRGRSAWWPVVMWVGVFVFVSATVLVGWRYLRPPFRAVKADWTYELGFLPRLPETPAAAVDDPEAQSRWIQQHAIETIPVQGRWLALTVVGGPPDIAQHPQRLEVRRRGRIIISVERRDQTPQTWYIKAPDDATRMMLEFDVSRTWRPSDFGGTDTRTLGLLVREWTFVKEPPRNAVAIY